MSLGRYRGTVCSTYF